MMIPWLCHVLILAAMMGALTTSSSAAAEHVVTRHQLMGRRATVASGGARAAVVVDATPPHALPTFEEFHDVASPETGPYRPNIQSRTPPTKRAHEDPGTRGSVRAARRRTADLDDMLNDMATRDPSQWSAAEWLIMILFISFLGWVGCCLLTMCCCGGGGGGGDLLRCLCCYEICCRGGSDIDACCDNYGTMC